jgi:hypothetical protein
MLRAMNVAGLATPYVERYVARLVTIRRRRILPFSGRVTRRLGERVAADSVVAETDMPRGYHLIELNQVLGRRVRDARKVMVKRIGDAVEKDEVIVRTGTLFTRQYASPVEGQILDVRDNRVLIQIAPQHIELSAFYPGQIMDVLPGMGVVIETSGALVQGVWGTGQALRATLHAPVPGGDVPLLAGQISDEHVGAVVVGGRTLDEDAIAKATEGRVRAVVVGSISSRLLPMVEESGLSLILTEGVGDYAMAADTFELLQSCVGQEVCFNPAVQAESRIQRPEIFCYAPGEDGPPLTAPSTSLEVGARVRALRAPYQNDVGEIVSLPVFPRRLASGAEAWGAEVDLPAAGKVFIPLENLELLR